MREDGLALVAVGAERRGVLDRAQAFMALLEGYAEHVMDAVGADLLDDLPALRAALERRRRERSGLLRLLEKLIGLDLKLRQYEQGKAFCDAVVARGGSPASIASGRARGDAHAGRARRPGRLARTATGPPQPAPDRGVDVRTCVASVTRSRRRSIFTSDSFTCFADWRAAYKVR